jgi:hypothetical protein
VETHPPFGKPLSVRNMAVNFTLFRPIYPSFSGKRTVNYPAAPVNFGARFEPRPAHHHSNRLTVTDAVQFQYRYVRSPVE